METGVLEKMGLSKAEIRIYLTLLQTGSVPSGMIVKETGFRKSTVYETIGRLQEKGLVSYMIKDGVKHFSAANPERILDYLEEQKRRITLNENLAKKLVCDLNANYDILRPQAEAHVLSGIEGFKTMRRDVLRNSGGELLLLGAISIEDEVMGAFFRWWNKERQKQKLKLRILHKESARGKEMTKNEVMGKYFETRFLPKEIESPAVINIYGDRVVNLVWKGRHPLCLMMINKENADSYRKYFELLWKLSK